MQQDIIITKEEMNRINDILDLSYDEILEKYDIDEPITHRAKFPNSVQADITLVIDIEGTYVKGILSHKGLELDRIEPEYTYDGEWCFEHNGIEYTVNVIVDE